MLIYSTATNAFIARLYTYAREILEREMGISFLKSRFFYQGTYYPLSFVIFEGKHTLGYFDASYYQIGINQKLMYMAKEKIIKDLLRHELAHFYTYIRHGQVEAHGQEFLATCEKFNWDQSVSLASIEVMEENFELEGDLKTEDIISKVQKLLKLAQSDNVHEAELATLRANQLITKHNLNFVAEAEEHIMYAECVYQNKVAGAKLSSIYEIIQTFLVKPVISMGKKEARLMVHGSRTNVEIAKYIAHFLDRELERMWLMAKTEYKLEGKRHKNSFFRGVAKGYTDKHKENQKSYAPVEKNALVKIKNDIEKKFTLHFPKLGSRSSYAENDLSGLYVGHKMGLNLSLRAGVKNNSVKYLE